MSMTDKELTIALTKKVHLDEANTLISKYESGELVIDMTMDGQSKNSKQILKIAKELDKTEKLQKQLRNLEEKARTMKFREFWKKNTPTLKTNWKNYRKENKGATDLTLLKEFIKASGISGVEVIEKQK